MTTKKVAVVLALSATFGAGAALASTGGGRPQRTSTDIPIYTASTIKPISGRTLKAPKKPARRNVHISYFFGKWQLWVPGTTYQLPGSDGYDVQVTSTGAQGRALAIRANGTWAWKGKTGRWSRTGDPDYPLVLLHADLGHNWKVGTAPASERKAQIVVWDGYVWEFGRRL